MTELEPTAHGSQLIVLRPGEAPPVAYSDLDYAITEETAADLVAAQPANTKRAYDHAWGCFARWCAESGRTILPATAQTFTEYVHALIGTGVSPATVEQAMGAIRTKHRKAGYAEQPDTSQPLELLREYRRQWVAGGNKVRKRNPILIADLRKMVETCDRDTPAGVRDRALLLLGFNMMARRSELSARNLGDLVDVAGEGIVVRIGSSKTDQAAKGVNITVPYGQHEATCAVRAVRAWRQLLASRGLTSGPLFRPIDRHGRIGGEPGKAGTPGARLTGHHIGEIVTRRAQLAHLPAGDWGAHGLRAGAATAAYAAGVPVSAIARLGRWSEKSPVVLGYIRAVDDWNNHPMKGIGL